MNLFLRIPICDSVELRGVLITSQKEPRGSINPVSLKASPVVLYVRRTVVGQTSSIPSRSSEFTRYFQSLPRSNQTRRIVNMLHKEPLRCLLLLQVDSVLCAEKSRISMTPIYSVSCHCAKHYLFRLREYVIRCSSNQAIEMHIYVVDVRSSTSPRVNNPNE